MWQGQMGVEHHHCRVGHIALVFQRDEHFFSDRKKITYTRILLDKPTFKILRNKVEMKIRPIIWHDYDFFSHHTN